MGESAMTQEVVWGVDKIELEKSILSVILQKKSKSRVGKSYRSVTKFTLGTNIPYCTFFKFYIIVWRRLYHFYHECREEDEPWMTHPFCLDDDFFFKTKFFFFLLLFGYFLAKSPFFWPSLHFEKWDLSLDPISCHKKSSSLSWNLQ